MSLIYFSYSMIKHLKSFSISISLLSLLTCFSCKKEQLFEILPNTIFNKKWQLTEAWYSGSDGIKHNNLSPLDYHRDNYTVFYADSTFIEYENTLVDPLDTTPITSRGTWMFTENNTKIHMNFQYIKLVLRSYSSTKKIIELSDSKFQTHWSDTNLDYQTGSTYVTIP